MKIVSDFLSPEEEDHDKTRETRSSAPSSSASPLIFIQHGDVLGKHTFLGMKDGMWKARAVMNPPRERRDRICLAAPQGWLFTYDYEFGYCSLLRPLSSSEQIPLPPLPERCFLCGVELPNPSPIDPDRRVVILLQNREEGGGYGGEMRVLSCNLNRTADNDCGWVRHAFGDLASAEPISMTSLHGTIYVLFRCGSIVDINPGDPRRSSVVATVPEGLDSAMGWACLIGSCDGGLYVVERVSIRGTDMIMMRVHKMDFSVGWWVMVGDIGDQALFVCESGSFSLPVERGGAGESAGFRRNCIYHLSDDEHEKIVFVYSLDDHDITMKELDVRIRGWVAPMWVLQNKGAVLCDSG